MSSVQSTFMSVESLLRHTVRVGGWEGNTLVRCSSTTGAHMQAERSGLTIHDRDHIGNDEENEGEEGPEAVVLGHDAVDPGLWVFVSFWVF